MMGSLGDRSAPSNGSSPRPPCPRLPAPCASGPPGGATLGLWIRSGGGAATWFRAGVCARGRSDAIRQTTPATMTSVWRDPNDPKLVTDDLSRNAPAHADPRRETSGRLAHACRPVDGPLWCRGLKLKSNLRL